jgi:hypothetical protein
VAAVAEGNEAGAKSRSQINLCNSEREEATNLANLAAAALKIYENDLANLETDRAREIEVYNTRRQRLVDVQGALDTTLAFVDELEAEAGGLVNQAFVQMTNKLLQATVRTGHSHMVLPVYTRLLQMHATQDFGKDAIGEIRSLLNSLRENTVNSIVSLDNDEAANLARYNDNHARLDDLISRLSSQVAISDDYIFSMSACVDQETSISALSDDKVSRNTDLLEQARKLCQATEDEFTQAELSRTKQNRILDLLETGVSRYEKRFEAENTSRVGDIIELRLL